MMTTFNTAGLKALFTYPFRQPNWQSKLLVLGLLFAAGFIIPFVPWLFVGGYFAEIMRRQALEGGEPELPEWDDWGRLAMDGFRQGVIGFVLSLPMTIVYFGGMALYFVSFLPMAMSQGEAEWAVGFMFISIAIMFLSMFLGTLLSIVTGIISPAALTHVAVKRSFGAVFEVREWWKVMWANLGGYLIALAITFSAYYLFFMTSYMLTWTLIFCFLGPILYFVTTPYLMVLAGVVFGQVYREGQLKRAELTEQVVEPEPVVEE